MSLFLPAEYSRIALSWAKLLEPAPDRSPDFVTVQLPDMTDDPRIRVHPECGITTVLGSDHTGEAKKPFLRLYMYRVKQQGGIGLHAGSKRVTLADEDDTHDVGQLFLGLSATGKSTLTSHGLWLDDPEGVEMIQDDVCGLLPLGTVAGSGGRRSLRKDHRTRVGRTAGNTPGYDRRKHRLRERRRRR